MTLSRDQPLGRNKQLTELKFIASGSQLEAETDTDIIVLSETTESTSATRQLPSRLDKLTCPTKSDFCRKRKVQSLKPTTVKKRHQAGTSNPTDPKGITVHSREKEFPNEYLIVRNSKLFCSACREELVLKKSTITNHITSGEKHKKAKEALEKKQAREQNIAKVLKVYDQEVQPKGSASVSTDARVYRNVLWNNFFRVVYLRLK